MATYFCGACLRLYFNFLIMKTNSVIIIAVVLSLALIVILSILFQISRKRKVVIDHSKSTNDTIKISIDNLKHQYKVKALGESIKSPDAVQIRNDINRPDIESEISSSGIKTCIKEFQPTTVDEIEIIKGQKVKIIRFTGQDSCFIFNINTLKNGQVPISCLDMNAHAAPKRTDS